MRPPRWPPFHRFRVRTEHSESPLRLQNAIWEYTNRGALVARGCRGRRRPAYRHRPRIPEVPFTDFEDTGLDLITPQFSLDKYRRGRLRFPWPTASRRG